MRKSTTTATGQVSTTVNAMPHQTELEKPNLDGDYLNFYLLILLYTIQFFPLSLAIGILVILQSNTSVNFENYVVFSFVSWPHTLKVFWAPVVDALFIEYIGRRKCWFILLQLLMALLFFYLADGITDWLPESGKPNIMRLCIVMFALNLLSSILDIVIDGWALTILQKKNVSYASTCNIVGGLIGLFIGESCFPLFVSEEFYNKYFQTVVGHGGLITMKCFLLFWAILVVSVTFLVGMFKYEKKIMEYGYQKISIFQSYKLIWDMLKLSHVRRLTIIMLTARICFVATEVTPVLKLIIYGISRDDIMMVQTLHFFLKLIVPTFASKYITSEKTMSYYLNIMPIRLGCGFVLATMVYFTPSLIYFENGIVKLPVYFYLTMGFVYVIIEMMTFFMKLFVYSFFCQISDPRFGGTYMSLFSTFFILGWVFSNTTVFELLNIATIKKCSNDPQNSCSTPDLTDICHSDGGHCILYHEYNYIIITGIFSVIGLIWYGLFKNDLKKFESSGLSYWMIR